jgi:hypothetical protein
MSHSDHGASPARPTPPGIVHYSHRIGATVFESLKAGAALAGGTAAPPRPRTLFVDMSHPLLEACGQAQGYPGKIRSWIGAGTGNALVSASKRHCTGPAQDVIVPLSRL